MDNKECVAVLSTDMGKAFEELHHALMIKKPEAHGFSDISLEQETIKGTERASPIYTLFHR